MTGRWFSLATSPSSTKKTDRRDKTEILLKVVLKSLFMCLGRHFDQQSYELYRYHLMYFFQKIKGVEL